MLATLKTLSKTGKVQELRKCSGIGELYWPYIRLEPAVLDPLSVGKTHESMSQTNLTMTVQEFSSARSLRFTKQKQPSASGKTRSTTKIKEAQDVHVGPKQYYIEVTAPNGWPLTLAQWKKVDEVRNIQEYIKVEVLAKKQVKEKSGSAKDKDKTVSSTTYQPHLGDAFAELECSISGDGLTAKRDDTRDVEFALARKNWDANEPGRNLRGAQLRKEFRAAFLKTLPPPPSESSQAMSEETCIKVMLEEERERPSLPNQQGPTPVTESGILEMSVESEEDAKYLTMPEQLMDKFIPLYFVPLCTKDVDENERIVLTPETIELEGNNRKERIRSALDRMKELQEYNELYVIGRQKDRCRGLEKLFIDAQWKEALSKVLEERDNAIARETLSRTLSVTKKKLEQKKKQVK